MHHICSTGDQQLEGGKRVSRWSSIAVSWSIRRAARGNLRLVSPPLLPLLLGALLAPVMLALFHYGLVDDAYISFRYAHNLALGYGLVFNAGQHVEGYSDLLWVLILALPSKLGMPLDVCAVVLGVLFAALALVECWRICRTIDVSPLNALLAMIALGLLPDYWQSMAFGLETGLYAFLLMRTVYLAVDGTSPARCGIYGALLFMTRPEGLIVLPLCLLYQVIFQYEDPAGMPQPRRMLPLLVPWLALVLAVTAWRLAYYGALLPNTMIAKAPPHTWGVLHANVLSGIRYWERFLITVLPLTLGLPIAALLPVRRAVAWLCLAILAAQIPVILINSGDWMPHSRLLMPYAPLMAVLLAMALQGCADARRAAPRWNLYRLAARTLALTAVLIAVQLHPPVGQPSIAAGVTEPCYERITRSLAPYLQPSDSISPEALGLASYLLPRTESFDLLGLTDAFVARHGTIYLSTYGKADPAYTFFVARPHVIVAHDYWLIQALARSARGRYNATYATFRLPFPLVATCEKHMTVSVLRTALPHLQTALALLRGRRIAVH
jgi:hypothetical protein